MQWHNIYLDSSLVLRFYSANYKKGNDKNSKFPNLVLEFNKSINL